MKRVSLTVTSSTRARRRASISRGSLAVYRYDVANNWQSEMVEKLTDQIMDKT